MPSREPTRGQSSMIFSKELEATEASGLGQARGQMKSFIILFQIARCPEETNNPLNESGSLLVALCL